VARDVLWNGALTNDEVCAEYFGGILASSRSEDGSDDGVIYYVDVIKSLSSKQLKLHYVIYNSFNKLWVYTWRCARRRVEATKPSPTVLSERSNTLSEIATTTRRPRRSASTLVRVCAPHAFRKLKSTTLAFNLHKSDETNSHRTVL
jgi:hypothetical protein